MLLILLSSKRQGTQRKPWNNRDSTKISMGKVQTIAYELAMSDNRVTRQ